MAIMSHHLVDSLLLGETDNAGNRRDHLTGAIGSVTNTVDQSAVLRNSYRISVVRGFTATTTPEPVIRFTWTGESGSLNAYGAQAEHYNRTRFYGRTTGRWTSVDPLWPEESAYGYVDANPTTWIDPSGMAPCPSIVNTILEKLQVQILHVSWDKGAVKKINACIQEAARSRNTVCDPFRTSTVNCLRDRFPFVRCGDPGEKPCVDPSLQGMINSLPTPVQTIIGPRPTFTLCFENVCYPTTGMPSYYPGLGNTPSGRIWITLLHEALHGCGFNHGKEKGKGSEPPPERSCNEIATCCFDRIVS